jgi:hypothetical protein
MRTSRLVGAVLMFLVGLIFTGQGLGYVGGSAMSGSSFWAGVGAILIVAAVGLAIVERRRTAGA